MKLHARETSTSRPACHITDVFSRPELSHSSLCPAHSECPGMRINEKRPFHPCTDLSPKWKMATKVDIQWKPVPSAWTTHTWLTLFYLSDQSSDITSLELPSLTLPTPIRPGLSVIYSHSIKTFSSMAPIQAYNYLFMCLLDHLSFHLEKGQRPCLFCLPLLTPVPSIMLGTYSELNKQILNKPDLKALPWI